MRKPLSILLILSVLLNAWYAIPDPLYNTVVWVDRGSSYEYYYFNITLEDIDVFGRAAMIGVNGLQGSKDIVLELSGQKSADVFGDGTITITLLDLASSSAKISITVDAGALATVASNLLEEKIKDAVNEGLPQSKIDEYNSTLKAARQYIQLGEYMKAVDLCKKTMALIDGDIVLAKEAMVAINNATLIIQNPRLVDENCTSCPDTVTSQAETKLKQAKNAFDSGDFTSAKKLANEAAKLIETCCKSCRIYSEKEKNVVAFLTSQSSEIPLKPAWDKVNDAKKEYALGDCIKAVQDLDSAKSLAEDIIKGWNTASSCRDELIGMISDAKGKYVISYGKGEKIQIVLDDIENRVYSNVTQYMKKGYFSTAVTNCNALKTEVSNRISIFTQTWGQMNVSYALLTSLQAKGYKIDEAWSIFNRAIDMFKGGNYTSASVEFEKAANIATQIRRQADEAQKWKNKTEACLLDLKMKGVNVDAVFGEGMSRAESLYSSGKYQDAEQQWKLVDKKCHDPGIANAIEQRKAAHDLYSRIKAEGIDIPEDITRMLGEADEDFTSGRFSDASTYYSKIIENLNSLEKNVKEAMNEIQETKKFISSSLPKYEKTAKLFGIPQLEKRLELLKELTANASRAYSSGDYSKVTQYVSKITQLEHDLDGDGIPDDSDILPQLPNYYIFGIIGVFLLFLINMLK